MEKTGWVDERESVKSEKESEKVGEKMQGSEIQEEEGGCAKEKKNTTTTKTTRSQYSEKYTKQ